MNCLCLEALFVALPSLCMCVEAEADMFVFMCAARLVAMREEKVENMANEVSPVSTKRQRRASGAGSPSPYTTPLASVGPTMSDDIYMLMDEEEKTSVSMSGGRSGGRPDREVLRVVTEGDYYDDGYRSLPHLIKAALGCSHVPAYLSTCLSSALSWHTLTMPAVTWLTR